jgi:hypothetical protein
MVSVDIIVFWILVLVLFAGLSVLFSPDSRDVRRATEHYGSWAPLAA